MQQIGCHDGTLEPQTYEDSCKPKETAWLSGRACKVVRQDNSISPAKIPKLKQSDTF